MEICYLFFLIISNTKITKMWIRSLAIYFFSFLLSCEYINEATFQAIYLDSYSLKNFKFLQVVEIQSSPTKKLRKSFWKNVGIWEIWRYL